MPRPSVVGSLSPVRGGFLGGVFPSGFPWCSVGWGRNHPHIPAGVQQQPQPPAPLPPPPKKTSHHGKEEQEDVVEEEGQGGRRRGWVRSPRRGHLQADPEGHHVQRQDGGLLRPAGAARHAHVPRPGDGDGDGRQRRRRGQEGGGGGGGGRDLRPLRYRRREGGREDQMDHVP